VKQQKNAEKSKLRPARGVDWGSAKDASLAAQQQRTSIAEATAVFKKLLDRPHAPATPWLLLRMFDSDPGWPRPNPMHPTFWESPDIWVESEDPLGNPVAGQPNYVHARITNLGSCAAVPVKVDFFWGDPSVGLDAGHMHRIGTKSEYVKIPPLQSVDVRCSSPWVPVLENGGHECLIVNCTNWVADPIQYPYDADLDRHVGQRNVHVIAGTPGKMVAIQIKLGNIMAAKTNTKVVAAISQAVVAKDLLGKLPAAEITARLLAFNPAGLVDGGIAAVSRSYDAPYAEGELTGISRFYHLRKTGGADTASLASAPAARTPEPGYSHSGTLLETALEPGEQKTIAVRIGVPQSAQPGEFIVCRLAQVVGETIVGGYTIIIRIGA
jgi:hypothetical protein